MVEIAGYITWFGIGALASVKLSRVLKISEWNVERKYKSEIEKIDKQWELFRKTLRENTKNLQENLVVFDAEKNLEIEYKGKPVLVKGKLRGSKQFYDYLKNPLHSPVVSAKGVVFSRRIYKYVRSTWIEGPQDGSDSKITQTQLMRHLRDLKLIKRFFNQCILERYVILN